MLAAVNAYRASRGLAAIPASQLDKNTLNRVDLRVTKGFAVGGRKIELVGQVFNLSARTTLAASAPTRRRTPPRRRSGRFRPRSRGSRARSRFVTSSRNA